MFLVTLPSLIMLIYAKSVSPSTFWYTLFYILVYTFLRFGIHFFINTVYIFLIQQLIGFIFGMHVSLGPGLYSPNVFGDAALIKYANLCKFIQNHIKCSYFLISRQILFKFGIQIYYRYKKSPNVFGDAALINYANLCKFDQNHIKCSYFLIS